MMNSKNDRPKFAILLNDELKSSIDEENDDEDENERPLLDRKEKSKRKVVNTKKGGYYELSKQDRDNVTELFESSNSKIVNAVDFDDDEEDEYEDDDEDYKDEVGNQRTDSTDSTQKERKKEKETEKKSIRKKLFGTSKSAKQSLTKQSSTDDELSLGKIKILIPRKKNKTKLIRYKVRKFLRNFFSLCFLLSALVVVFILLYFKKQYLNQFFKDHLTSPSSSVKRTLDQQTKHCDMLIVNNLWNISLPKLIVEQQIRMIDLNNDHNPDIVVTFSTSIDQAKYNPILCQIYFNQTVSNTDDGYACGGGVLLLDGQTGDEIWRMYSKHKIDSVNCFIDLDMDGINDCLAVGPRAGFYAINGRTGRIIWKLDAQNQGGAFQPNAAFHAPLLLPRDVDHDNLNDILVMHGGDFQRKTKSVSGRLFCISSRDGAILSWSHVPDEQDSYIPPLLYYRNENKDSDTIEIIYGTGGFNQPGSLWSINLDEFLSKNTLKKSTNIYKDCCKGILTPPILVDLNHDQIQDIVIALNSTVAALNGRTLIKMWHTKFPQNTEFHIPPAVGYFDDDDIPDFIVQYELGDGFPNTYYSEVQVLNGRDGKIMLKDSFKMLTGCRSAPITVSVDTTSDSSRNAKKSMNNSDQTIESFDLFLFWQTTCDNQEQELKKLTTDQSDQLRYKLKFNSINELEKTDFCRLRFGKNSVNRMDSVSFGNIMTTIYDSDEWSVKELEQNNKFNWTKHAVDFLAKNSDLLMNYMDNFIPGNYANEESDDLGQFLSEKKTLDNRDGSNDLVNYNANSGIYTQNDYSSSFKRPNDNSPFNRQDRTGFDLPNKPNYNLPNDNLMNPNNLANLIFNQYQQRQQQQQILQQQQQQQSARIPPPYLEGFDLNNRNKFVKKKSSPYDFPTLEEIFQRRRNKRSIITDDVKLIHKIYTTPTLAPSKLKNGIDIVFAINLTPENQNVKLIKKSEYDNCIQMAQKNKFDQSFSKSDFISYCDKQLNKNEDKKKSSYEMMIKKQLGSATIYRNSLKCKNTDFHMKNYEKQIWPAHLGAYGNGMANV